MFFLFPGIILSCDLFNTSMVDYFLDNTGSVEVTGIGGRPKYVLAPNGTILIPPSGDEPLTTIEVLLSNPRNLAVRQELLGVPEGKNISSRLAGTGGIELSIAGAEEGDDYALTLAMRSPDGLRDFSPYSLTLTCVSFETALEDFTVNGMVPPDFDPAKGAFSINVPYAATTVMLGGTTVHPKALIEIYAGTDDSGAVLVRDTHRVSHPVSLNTEENYFYIKITAPSSSVRGYDLTVYRDIDSGKEITDFYFTIGTKRYGIGSGVESGSGTISGNTIMIEVPDGTDLTSLAPVITVSAGASVNPQSGTAANFSTPQTYTVTAADGTSRAYTVTVANPAPMITISGITVEGLAALTFTGPPSTTTGLMINVTINGGAAVSAWYIELSNASVTETHTTNTFAAPMIPGFYNVNVIATVGGVDYSGSFGLTVNAN
jgi:hypothetical protein